MTTNQTIDGVPRELLERVATEANHMLGFTSAANYDECRAAVDELRALLDAEPEGYPPCDYCGIVPAYHPWNGSGLLAGVENPHIHACNECRHLLPAAQPQGEPVAWRSCAAINGKHYITEDSPDQQQERIDKSDPGAYLLASQPLYLGPPEQPAPVAVVMPERKCDRKLGQHLMENYRSGWNAYLDELKHLNNINQ